MKPDGPVHVVDDIGHANLHRCPGQADRSHDEPHWTFLVGENMLDAGTDLRLAAVGASDMSWQGFARLPFAVDTRAQASCFQMGLIRLRAIGGIHPDIAGRIVGVEQHRELGTVMAGRVRRLPFPDQPMAPVDPDRDCQEFRV